MYNNDYLHHHHQVHLTRALFSLPCSTLSYSLSSNSRKNVSFRSRHRRPKPNRIGASSLGAPTFGGEPCWRRRPTPREVNGVKGIHPSDRPASLPLRCGRLAGAREGGRVSSCVNAKYYGQVRFGLVLVDPARHSVAALAVVCSRSLKYRVVRVLAKEDHLRVVMDGAKTLRWARRLQRTAAWLT